MNFKYSKCRYFIITNFILLNFVNQLKCNSVELSKVAIKFGQPIELYTDKPGHPLNETDFSRARNLPRVGDEILAINEVDPIEMAGFFQGDIILQDFDEYERLTTEETDTNASLRNAIINLEKKWPKGEIPYLISARYNANERALIANAVLIIHNKTCIRFVPRSDQKDYIHILMGDGCSSSVGRVGGAQTVSIGAGCLSMGIIMHELMHSTGFWHEHSRGDRDDNIDVIWSNIRTGMRSNFDKYDWNTIQSLGIDYDLGSIMHYGPYAFALDRSRPTIIPRRKYEIGQRRNFSAKDLKKMNLLYNCPGTSTTEKCEDSHKYCSDWALSGECENNPEWMRKNCKRACKQCKAEQKCEDLHIYCSSWAKVGECSSNPNYMLINCRASCGSCL